ncbi:Transcription factor Dp-1 [Phytophthora citrophthora]|uniref:Transcription factor Dp-1 n=1 Tax=Phytophthora citrophthora TaxID=4793 RepID=A0AAD9LRE4_9STRA|nr:Transcription factor Dp-1 [Phytophthora citrophthora]
MSAKGTQIPDNLQSPVGKKTTTKAPGRVPNKRRAGAAANGATKRPTRRELNKKLLEVELEEKNDVPAVPIKAENTATVPFGVDAASASITPTSLHDDFVNMMKTQGLEKIATEAGILKNGSLVEAQAPATPSVATASNKPASGKKPISAASALTSPSFTSPYKGLTNVDDTANISRSPGKKRKYLKINKGLRHFSMKVCQKVEEKHVTSYNEVADELVREFVTMRPNDAVYDEKNIRRRVYDALNVLMAMDIISKERKEIRWKGLPSNLQHDTEMLLAERNERMKSVEQKKQHLQDLLVQQVAMKNLLRRNAERKRKESENPAFVNIVRDEGRVFLPFIAVNTSKDTVIQCEMSEDRQDIFFNFSAPFEIHDDADILQKLNLHKAPYADLKQMVPDKLLSYLPAECEMKSEE